MQPNSLKRYKQDDDGVLWISNYVGNARLTTAYKVKELLHYEQSPFQEISVVNTKGFGKMLVLDGTPQISTGDGFIYNEMISHIPIVTHANPKKVAMIGGGDCGPAREAMKYDSIEQIDVIEIDQQVTEVCRNWLTPSSQYDNDKRFNMIHNDGLEWIKKSNINYDVLIIDRPDPVGPGQKLFRPDFYKYVFDRLTSDGLAVFQSGSPVYNISTLKKTNENLKKRFPIVRTYLVTIPLFPCGLWSFIIASKKWDPLKADISKLQDNNTNYINGETFFSSFSLPNYVKKIVADS